MEQNLNDISFTLGTGGSGQLPSGSDYISGLLVFNNTRPAAFTAALTSQGTFANGGVLQLFGLPDAVNAGINNLYTDETQATGSMLVTAIGATGDTVAYYFQEWTSNSAGKGKVFLGQYTKAVGDTTTVLVATAVAAAINANTNIHGYTAVASGSTVTLTVRKGLGVFPNSGTPITAVYVGGITSTITQPSGGVASKLAVYYYHIQRYFIKNPNTTLYLGIFNTAGASTFADLANMSTAAGGGIVQCGIWDDQKPYALSSLTLIQGVLDTMRVDNQIISQVTYSADIKALSTPLSSLAGSAYNLANLTAKNVSALIDNDGGATGYDLFQQLGITISSLGANLGCISLSAISEDYGNTIPTFDCNDGSEFNTLMFGDGTLYSNVSQSQLNALNTNRYVFLSKIPNPGSTGSWYSDDHTAITITSDYAYTHNNRVIDRVIKNEFLAMIPLLKAKILLQTNGTLTTQSLMSIYALTGPTIQALIGSQDLAGDPNSFDVTKWILINASQNIQQQGYLQIGIKLAENAIAHSVRVPIGFGTF